MANEQNLIKYKKGQSGNLKGKPKGTLSLSTHIQNLLNDENLDVYITHPKEGYKKLNGVPVKAIVLVAIQKAIMGEPVAREWLSKYGYGAPIETPDPLNIVFKVVNKVPVEDE
jgi:Family of unknown function (DUF5681)